MLIIFHALSTATKFPDFSEFDLKCRLKAGLLPYKRAGEVPDNYTYLEGPYFGL